MGDFLTTKEAAELLGVTDRTLRNWTDKGSIQVVRTQGGHRRYKKDDILKSLGRNMFSNVYFFLIHDGIQLQTRYKASFLPRIGDTICIADSYLSVQSVVVNTAKSDGGGAQHTLEVHVIDADPINPNCDPYITEEVELDEFSKRIKGEI